MLTAVITTNDLPNLAREINDAHRQVRMHAKGMLIEARRAGEALLVAKQQCEHGEFETWIRANCEVSYRQARKYMQVAKLAPQGRFDPELGINAFLDAHAEPKAQPKAPKANPFTRVDAEHVMKLQRLADSTANENEAAVAQSKLDDFASRFDMTAEEAVVKSREELDLDWVEKEQQFGTLEQITSDLVRKGLAKKSNDELVKLIVMMILANRDNLDTIKDYLK
jgi:hypothetical protein